MKKPIAYLLVLLALGLLAFLMRGLKPPTPNPPEAAVQRASPPRGLL